MNKHYWLLGFLCLLLPSNLLCQTQKNHNAESFPFQQRAIKNSPIKSSSQKSTGISTLIKSAGELVNETLIGGTCGTASNINASSNNGAFGSFSNGNSSISLEEGILLSTGHILNTQGANINTGTTFNWPNNGVDPDLQQIAGANAIFDVAYIEFDFIPTVNALSLEFVFASEEYCEFANSPYNDVFGLFVSGPGFSGIYSGGAENVALLPGTNTNISVATINHTINQSSYNGNIPAGNPILNHPDCTGHPTSGIAVNEIEFDGFTDVLSATLNLVPCETYHFKIAIADVYDDAYDSAVFLNAESFQIGGAYSANAISPSNNASNIAYEGCSDGFFEFTRSNNDTSSPLNINFSLSPNSTASAGLDFIPFPNAVTIPTGQMSIQLPIEILLDQLTEGNESIILDLTEPCTCTSSTIELQIADTPPLILGVNNATICEGTSVDIIAQASGGVPGVYSYLWDNGMTGASIQVNPASSTSYVVTVSDICGNSQIATAQVTVQANPSAEITGSGTICSNGGNAPALDITFSENGSWEFIYTIDGNPQSPIITSNNPYQLLATAPGNYELFTATAPNGCLVNLFGLATIEERQINLAANVTEPTCAGLQNGNIDLAISGAQNPLNFMWNNGVTSSSLQNIGAGNYSVTLTDNIGCTATFATNLNTPNPLTINSNINSVPTCNNPLGGSISTIVSGGIPPYQFLWNNGITNQNLDNLSNGTYTVTLTDANNCTNSENTIINEDLSTPIAQIELPAILNCNQPDVQLSGLGSSLGGNFAYNWTTPNGNLLNATNTLNPTINQAGNYFLTVANLNNGCMATTEIEVFANFDAPTINPTISGALNCQNTSVELNANSTNSNLNFTWEDSFGNILPGGNSSTIAVNEAGIYQLEVTNFINGCTAISSIEVTENLTNPEVDIEFPDTITCIQALTSLNIYNPNSTFDYSWSSPNGNILGNPISPNIEVNSGGIYLVNVLNPENGCNTIDSMNIVVDTIAPAIQLAQDLVLNCFQPHVFLQIDSSANGFPFEYYWETFDGNIVNENNQGIEINEVGTYYLTAINAHNGCSAQTSTNIAENFNAPIIELETPGIINCQNETIILNASNSQISDSSSIYWTSLNGNILSGATTLNPEINQSGVYELFIIDLESGCTESQSIEVESNTELPSVNIQTPEQLSCSLSQMELIAINNNPDGAYFYEWFTQNGTIETGQNSLSPTISAPGIYELSIIDSSNFCTTEIDIIVEADDDIPQITASANSILNCTQTEISLTGIINGAGDWQIQWSSLDGNFIDEAQSLDPIVDTPGFYQLSVTNAANNCSSTETVEVIGDFVSPNISITNPTILTCEYPTQILTASVSDAGQTFEIIWQSLDGNILNNGNSLTPEINEPGIYSLIIENVENHCTATADIEVFENTTSPILSIAPPANINCENPIIQFGNINPAQDSNFIYEWTTFNGNIISDISKPLIEVNQAGLYELSVIDNENGCKTQTAVEVFANLNQPELAVNEIPVITCSQTEVEVILTTIGNHNNAIYEWTSTDGNILSTTNEFILFSDTPGIYQLTVMDSLSSCSSSQTIEIQQQGNLPFVEIGIQGELNCENNPVTLFAGNNVPSNNLSFEWTTNGGHFITSVNEISSQIDAPGLYTLTITNLNNGCQNNATVEINVANELPEIEIQLPDTLNCIQTQISLLANSNSTEFSPEWTSSNGNIESGANTWNPIINTPGIYFLTISNQSGSCSAMDSVIVLQNIESPLLFVESPEELNCIQTAIQLNASVPVSSPNYIHQWTTTNGNITAGENTLTPEVDAPGFYKLSLLDSENGCMTIANFEVIQNIEIPIITIETPDLLTCIVDTIQLNATLIGNSNYQILWHSDSNPIENPTSLNPSISQAGIYELSILNIENGCTTSSMTEIFNDFEMPTIVLDDAPLLTCLADTILLDASNSIIEPNFDIAWNSIDGNIISEENTLMISVDAPGTYSITITNPENGCQNNASHFVEADQIYPIIDAGENETIACDENNITLNGSIAANNQTINYLWQSEDGHIIENEQSLNPVIEQEGNYFFWATNLGNGCTAIDSILVIKQEVLNAEIQVEQGTCDNPFGSILITNVTGGTSPYLYSIDDGAGFLTNNHFENLEAGTYPILIEDVTGCLFEQEHTIQTIPELKVELETEKTEIQLGDELQLDANIKIPLSQISTIEWTPNELLSCNDCLNPIAKPIQSETFTVEVTTEVGCQASAHLNITVNQQEGIYVPNAFSPNEDGQNDIFMIYAKEGTVKQIDKFLIFNRWGEQIATFSNILPNDSSSGWDGMFKGKAQESGIYIWMAEIEMEYGEKRIMKGEITLLGRD